MNKECMSSFLAGAFGLAMPGELSVLVRRDGALTVLGSVDESASMEPNDLTVSAKWAPVVEGAAGDDESIGLGESTVPKARDAGVSQATMRIYSLFGGSTPDPTIKLPLRE